MKDTPARKKSSLNREKILSVTRALMTEKGVKQTTLADISREAEISQGTLFYYYKSKNDLIYDILEQHFSALTDSIIASIPRYKNTDGEKLLRGSLEKLIKDQETGRMNIYLFQEAMLDNSDIKDRFVIKYHTWRELIARQISSLFGVKEPDDLTALGGMILAIIDGLTIQYLLDPGSVDFKKAAQLLTGMIDSAAVREKGSDQ